jgi:hypothetical protein
MSGWVRSMRTMVTIANSAMLISHRTCSETYVGFTSSSIVNVNVNALASRPRIDAGVNDRLSVLASAYWWTCLDGYAGLRSVPMPLC